MKKERRVREREKVEREGGKGRGDSEREKVERGGERR